MKPTTKSKLLSVISYLTFVCWIIALLLRDKDDSLTRHHLNQSLPLIILEAVCGIFSRWRGIFRLIGEIGGVVVAVLAIIGIIRAIKGSEEPLPIIGSINAIP